MALVGAESSGKSTLCKKLAKKFNTNYVPEYGRTYVEYHGDKFDKSSFLHIAKTHESHANSLKCYAGKYFFYDTEAFVTATWQDFFLNTSSSEDIELIGIEQGIDLYVMLPVQDFWIKDPVRYHEEKKDRELFYNNLKSKLIKNNMNFIEIKTLDFNLIEEEIVDYLNNNLKSLFS